MRAQPEMQPWVHTDKSRMSSVGAALTARAFVLRLGSVAPLVLKNVRALHNTALAALLVTFRFGHLQE